MVTVRAVKNFGFPRERQVRDKIREFHAVKKNVGTSWPGNRGDIVEVKTGDVLQAPTDLLDSWLAAELVLVPVHVDGDPEEEDNDG